MIAKGTLRTLDGVEGQQHGGLWVKLSNIAQSRHEHLPCLKKLVEINEIENELPVCKIFENLGCYNLSFNIGQVWISKAQWSNIGPNALKWNEHHACA